MLGISYGGMRCDDLLQASALPTFLLDSESGASVSKYASLGRCNTFTTPSQRAFVFSNIVHRIVRINVRLQASSPVILICHQMQSLSTGSTWAHLLIYTLAVEIRSTNYPPRCFHILYTSKIAGPLVPPRLRLLTLDCWLVYFIIPILPRAS